MGNASNNDELTLEKQYYLAKLLLQKYETFHPFFEVQLSYYSVACCDISLGGEVRLHIESKTITYDIKTEKMYKKQDGKFKKIKKSKITAAKYKKECLLAKQNLQTWTKELLWGSGTTVKVYVDGKLTE